MHCAGWCHAGCTRRGRHRSRRRDPVEILVETSRHRISSLLPIRYGRMQESPFAFLRGSAAVMAADLATTPTSGIWVQSCGDCHLANFGTYAALDGSPVFDITDFDETLPAPFEWDLKRLAVEFRGRCAQDAGCRSAPAASSRAGVVSAYRQQMARHDATRSADRLAIARATWRRCCAASPEPKLRQAELKRLRIAADAHRKGYPKLLETRQVRLAHQAPITVRRAGTCGLHDDTLELVARTAFEAYKVQSA